jgi:ABC-type transporter Mla subunit MlaD
MLLHTPYELKLPNDAVVSISTAGVLGPAFADISVARASGPPAANGSVMRTAPNQTLTTDELIRRVQQMMERLRCADATTSGATRKEGAVEKTPGHR